MTPGPAATPTRAGAVIVEARGLTAGYGGTPAIHGIDLEARAGEVVALLGANGAGKTTTLLALAGEIAPISGTIAFHGDARRRRLHQRARQGLGFLTEERCVFMQLTGWQNLKLGRGRPEQALEFFPELEEHLGKKVGLLSGGQQQMLALGAGARRRAPRAARRRAVAGPRADGGRAAARPPYARPPTRGWP